MFGERSGSVGALRLVLVLKLMKWRIHNVSPFSFPFRSGDPSKKILRELGATILDLLVIENKCMLLVLRPALGRGAFRVDQSK